MPKRSSTISPAKTNTRIGGDRPKEVKQGLIQRLVAFAQPDEQLFDQIGHPERGKDNDDDIKDVSRIGLSPAHPLGGVDRDRGANRGKNPGNSPQRPGHCNLSGNRVSGGMVRILSSDRAPTRVLRVLEAWNHAEWGAEAFSDPDPGLVTIPGPIVAVDAHDQLIAGLTFTSAPAPGGVAPCLWINTVLVSPKARGQGIASALVKQAMIVARPAHRKLFVLSEFPALYLKLGWSILDGAGGPEDPVLNVTL